VKIQEQELFHGAAIVQVVEYANNVIVQKTKGQNGHFVINKNTNLILKYRSHRKPPWRFALSENEEVLVRDLLRNRLELYLVLVCSNDTICALSSQELELIVDVFAIGDKWINVSTGYGKSLWVAGSRGELNYSIRHNDFPKKIFEHGETGGI
jgi:hypothetical protein